MCEQIRNSFNVKNLEANKYSRKAECNIYIDAISFCNQHAKKRQDFAISKKDTAPEKELRKATRKNT